MEFWGETRIGFRVGLGEERDDSLHGGISYKNTFADEITG